LRCCSPAQRWQRRTTIVTTITTTTIHITPDFRGGRGDALERKRGASARGQGLGIAS
jgi:hypothetical protein